MTRKSGASIWGVMGILAWLSFTTSILAVTGQVQAQSSPRWGVIDMQAVILNVEEGKKARARLEKEIKAKEKELKKQREELDKMNKEWKSQAALLSESARIKKQQDFQQRFLALRNAEMTFQQEIKRKEQKATQKIAVQVAKMVEKMAKKRKLEAVFETNTAGLLYLNNPVDLTKDVITAYGKSGNDEVAKKETKKKD